MLLLDMASGQDRTLNILILLFLLDNVLVISGRLSADVHDNRQQEHSGTHHAEHGDDSGSARFVKLCLHGLNSSDELIASSAKEPRPTATVLNPAGVVTAETLVTTVRLHSAFLNLCGAAKRLYDYDVTDQTLSVGRKTRVLCVVRRREVVNGYDAADGLRRDVEINVCDSVREEAGVVLVPAEMRRHRSLHFAVQLHSVSLFPLDSDDFAVVLFAVYSANKTVKQETYSGEDCSQR